MLQVRRQLQEVRQEISRETGRSMVQLQHKTEIGAALVRAIQQRIATLQGGGAAAHLRELERELASTRRLYESLLQREEELHEQRESLSPNVRILSLASPPDRPSSPNPLLFVLPALMVFSISGSLIAVLRERMDDTVRSEGDIGDALGIPCLGLVPRLRRTGGMRPHQHLLEKLFTPYTESIRSIST
jgi:uncharacterized protein involved in exopolysaccharide biosynthesis